MSEVQAREPALPVALDLTAGIWLMMAPARGVG
jgi:hypothetical protein